MPIKADLANEDAISYSGSLLNINQGLAQNISMTDLAAAANLNGATTTSSGGSGNGGTGGKQSLKSEKISRFDGGEQQIIVSIIHIKINF